MKVVIENSLFYLHFHAIWLHIKLIRTTLRDATAMCRKILEEAFLGLLPFKLACVIWKFRGELATVVYLHVTVFIAGASALPGSTR